MESKDIIDALIAEKMVYVKENAESVLYSKLAHKLQDKYEEISPPVFEAKKAKVTDKDNDSEDDSGETLDPVDKGELKGKHKHRDDKDIDNDGDVDDSDKFLHKKRKAISKSIKNEDHDCEEVHPDVSHKEWEKTQNKEEGTEVKIAKEKEKQGKSKEKIKDLSDRLAAEKEAEKE